MKSGHIKDQLFAPRLLPMTIVIMAALLVFKSGSLVLAAAGAAGGAGGAEAAPLPSEKSPPAKPSHGSTPVGDPARGGNKPASPVAALPAPAAEVVPVLTEIPVSNGERALLNDLRQRRVVLDAREAELASREVTMATVEKRLAARVDELTALQSRLEALERQRKERDEANWKGMVKLYESMKPRDASIIFNDLDMSVLLQVLDRMKETKAASILSAMAPDRARLVTIELAQLRMKSNNIESITQVAGAPLDRLPDGPAMAVLPSKTR